MKMMKIFIAIFCALFLVTICAAQDFSVQIVEDDLDDEDGRLHWYQRPESPKFKRAFNGQIITMPDQPQEYVYHSVMYYCKYADENTDGTCEVDPTRTKEWAQRNQWEHPYLGWTYDHIEEVRADEYHSTLWLTKPKRHRIGRNPAPFDVSVLRPDFFLLTALEYIDINSFQLSNDEVVVVFENNLTGDTVYRESYGPVLYDADGETAIIREYDFMEKSPGQFSVKGFINCTLRHVDDLPTRLSQAVHAFDNGEGQFLPDYRGLPHGVHVPVLTVNLPPETPVATPVAADRRRSEQFGQLSALQQFAIDHVEHLKSSRKTLRNNYPLIDVRIDFDQQQQQQQPTDSQ